MKQCIHRYLIFLTLLPFIIWASVKCRSIHDQGTVKVVNGETPSDSNILTQVTVVFVQRTYETSGFSSSIFWKPYCSGVLIKNDLVLTAGHCLDLIQRKSIGATGVYFGKDANELRSWNTEQNDPNNNVAPLLDFRIFPRFFQGVTSPSYDIGWARIDLTRWKGRLPLIGGLMGFGGIQYKPIAPDPQKFDSTGTTASVQLSNSGFGYSKVGNDPSKDVKGNLQTGQIQSIQFLDNNIIPHLVNATQSRSATCFGDSGGPLIAIKNGQVHLIGLTQGKFKGVHPELRKKEMKTDTKQLICTDPQFNHTVFTEIWPYLTWIQQSSGQSFGINISSPIASKISFNETTSVLDWCKNVPEMSDEQHALNLLAAAFVSQDGRNSDISQDDNYKVYENCDNFSVLITKLQKFVFNSQATYMINNEYPLIPKNLKILSQLPDLKEIDVDLPHFDINSLPKELSSLERLRARFAPMANLILPSMPKIKTIRVEVENSTSTPQAALSQNNQWNLTQLKGASQLRNLSISGGVLSFQQLRNISSNLNYLDLHGVIMIDQNDPSLTLEKALAKLFPNLETLKISKS